MENLNNTLIDWAKKYVPADSTNNNNNSIYECNIFGSRTIIIYNQEKLSIIDKYRTTSQIQRMEGLRNAAGSVGANGLFNATGLSWKRDKRMIGPFLNRQHIDDYVPSITLVATRLCKKWEEELLMMAKHNDDDDDIPYITINEDLLCTTMDIISLISCGHGLNSIEKKGKKEEEVVQQLDEDLRDVFHLVTLRSLVPFSFWNIPIIGQYMDGGGWKVHRVKRTLMKIVNDTKHSLLVKTSSRSSESDTTSSSSSTKKKLSFLRKLLIQHSQEDDEKKHHLDIDRLFGNLLTLFIAGTDTTTNTLCVCLYMLAADKVLQEKIASESLALFQQNILNDDALNNNGHDGKKKANSSQQMYEQCPRTMSFIYEVIRYYGPAPILFLENSKPIDMIGTTLPAKTQFMILNGYAMRCDSENDGEKCTPRGYKDSSPSIFDAERYLIFGPPSEDGSNDYEVSSTTATLHPTNPKTGFRGFGSSIRVCPGRQLAETEILLLLGCILRKFEVGLKENHPPLNMVFKTSLCPDSDIQITLKSRMTGGSDYTGIR